MLSHKFNVGEIVTIKTALHRNVPGGAYEIVQRLPENNGEFEYRIKSASEPHQRVARESELARM